MERATPAKIAAAERERKALELRMAGATFQAVADARDTGIVPQPPMPSRRHFGTPRQKS